MSKKLQRVFEALHRNGLDVSYDGLVYRLKQAGDSNSPEAEILLPEDFPVEEKAFQQLANFAAVTHPDGGHVCKVCATPDFHPGDLVPVGAVIATTPDMVIPHSIGSDINCGMRLHTVDMTLDAFLAKKPELIQKLKNDLLFGNRNLPTTPVTLQGIFNIGVPGFLEEAGKKPLGQLTASDWSQLEGEQDKIYNRGTEQGNSCWAPVDLVNSDRDVIRDPGLATVGTSNHFVEIQTVDEILDKAVAYDWGVRKGQIAFMIHSGSRNVGQYVGNNWMTKARDLWPKGLKYPASGIFALSGEPAQQYLAAEATASNYGYVNRMLLAELVRIRMREVYGQVEAKLIFDVPHNVVMKENGLNVHRKGATPAFLGQPVIIPGSMGSFSYLLRGCSNERFLNSASHGAGRAIPRFKMSHKTEKDLGLEGVECITIRDERRIEEAPAAYKNIEPVIDIQVKAGIATPVARMKPILTFKA